MSKNFKFGTKNNWRRWAWNQIAKRVENKRQALVLYLAGEQDLDRKIAMEKGFKSDNLIIVENNPGVVKSLRGQGKNVIRADIENVLANWPLQGPAVDVVIADFCSGLGLNLNIAFGGIFMVPSLWKTTYIVNLMRGRDPFSSHFKDFLNRQAIFEFDDLKNRAVLLMTWIALNALRGRWGMATGEWTGFKVTRSGWDEILSYLNSGFFSYRSGNLFFDSAVFNSPNRYGSDSEALEIISRFRAKGKTWATPRVEEVKKRISAALAIRTMRLNGTLPHSPNL